MFFVSPTTALSRNQAEYFLHTSHPRHMTRSNLHSLVNKGFYQSQRRTFNSSQSPKEGMTMSKTIKIALFLLLGGTLLTAFKFYTSEKSQSNLSEGTDQLIHTLNNKILDTLTHSEQVPGLDAEEFAALKEEISKTWKTLVQNGVLEISGTDKEVRPYFVALQGVIEHVISHELQNGIQTLNGMIHTPMPATPLCSKGEISKDLVDPAIEKDPNRLFTVKARTTIIRDFLHQGSYLYIIYPIGGMEKRTEIQQSIYQEELQNYPKQLFDKPLNCPAIPDELIGATYIFTNQKGDSFAFSIKMTQAKDPKENGNFGLWFGPLENREVSQRVKSILNFLEKNGVEITEFKTPS